MRDILDTRLVVVGSTALDCWLAVGCVSKEWARFARGRAGGRINLLCGDDWHDVLEWLQLQDGPCTSSSIVWSSLAVL